MVTSIRKYLDLLYFEMHKSEFSNPYIFATFDISNLDYLIKFLEISKVYREDKGIRNSELWKELSSF